MGRDWRQPRIRMKGAFLALAFVAVLVKVMVPVGFMAAERPTSHAFPFVICTAQGRATLPASTEHAPAHKSKTDAPCAFAANAAPPAPAEIAVLSAPFRAEPLAVREVRADLQPGRGLAAPPPPSQAPPAVLV
jgi:hypothetical protein